MQAGLTCFITIVTPETSNEEERNPSEAGFGRISLCGLLSIIVIIIICLLLRRLQRTVCARCWRWWNSNWSTICPTNGSCIYENSSEIGSTIETLSFPAFRALVQMQQFLLKALSLHYIGKPLVLLKTFWGFKFLTAAGKTSWASWNYVGCSEGTEDLLKIGARRKGRLPYFAGHAIKSLHRSGICRTAEISFQRGDT